MHTLILTVSALALVVLLSVASLWYGGTAFTTQRTAAEAARYLNESNQWRGALAAYRADHAGSWPTAVAQLTTGNYLRSAPSSHWQFAADYITLSDVAEATCLAVNQRMGVEGVPSCDAPNQASTMCCQR